MLVGWGASKHHVQCLTMEGFFLIMWCRQMGLLIFGGKVNALKMNCTPKLNDLLQSLPTHIPLKYFKHFDRVCDELLWGGKQPHMHFEKSQLPVDRAGLGLPKLFYHFTFSLRHIAHWSLPPTAADFSDSHRDERRKKSHKVLEWSQTCSSTFRRDRNIRERILLPPECKMSQYIENVFQEMLNCKIKWIKTAKLLFGHCWAI